MKREKTKKFLKILILPALLLTLSLTALTSQKSIAKADSTFSLKNVSVAKIVEGEEGITNIYTVTEEDVAISKEIEVDDTLNDVYVILDKSITSDSTPFQLVSTSGNRIETTSTTNSLILNDSSVFGATSNQYQLVYIDGNFGRISEIYGKVYLYGGNVNILKPIEVGDKVVGPTFCFNFRNQTSGYAKLFHSNKLEFVFNMTNRNFAFSNDNNPPATITNVSCIFENTNVIFNFSEGSIDGEVSIDSSTAITQLSEDYEVFKLEEVKANPEPEDAEPESTGPIGGGTGGGTIGNMDSTEDKPLNLNWLWYVGAGLLICGCALFVITRR
ncbi:MAG: hypothetical protein IKA99_07920 [Clostridia bacterium]|nr:hypothetical protein [Clostridia bacterium]